MKTYNLTVVSSYGSKCLQAEILDNASIDTCREKYLEMVGSYMDAMFDRKLSENKDLIKLPYGYNTVVIKSH